MATICLNSSRASAPAFFYSDAASAVIYTLSLHDALPICSGQISAGVLPTPIAIVGALIDHWDESKPPQWRLVRSEEHTSELQSHSDLVCRLLLEKKKQIAVRPAELVRLRSPSARQN